MTRFPTLDEAEEHSWADDTNARFSSHRWRDNREPSTRDGAIGILGDCWCGEPHRHDWPGKATGGPHPRGRQP